MYKMIGNEAIIGIAGWRTHWMDVKLVNTDNEVLNSEDIEKKFKCGTKYF
jgi:hypothetical protein